MKSKVIGGALCVVLASSACSIKQKVLPVGQTAMESEICVVENLAVRPAFGQAIVDNLEFKGYKVRAIAEPKGPTACPMTLRYTARWQWDLAMYLREASISVYRGDAQVGDARYDASFGGARPDKFISADDKVAELVQRLFPTGRPVWQKKDGTMYRASSFK